MEKFDPIEVEFLLNSDEVKIESKKIKDNIKGIGDTADDAAAKVGGKGGKGGITPPLDSAGAAAERAGKKAAASRTQWNGLGNSINQISRELPAFTYSAQTGFLALSNNIPILADEISRLKAKNAELTASGQKSVPVWKQVLKNLGSWNVLLSLAITAITIYGDKIADFIGNLFKSKEAIDAQKKAVEALNKAYESSEYQNIIKDIIQLRSQINLAKQGFIDKKDALDKYNKVLGDAYKKTDDLNEAEKILVEKAPALIESMLYKTAATLAAADAAKALAENQKKQFETVEDIDKKEKERQKALEKGTTTAGAAAGQFTNLGAGTAGLQKRKLQDELDELKKEAEKVQKDGSKIVEDLNQKAAEIAKAAGLDIFGDEDDNKPKTDKFIAERKKLLEKIADLDREFAQKRLNRDEEELDALREKFNKVRQLIEEFNNDPKNKQAKIDITGLGVIQENAEKDLKYKQGTRSLEEELKKQQNLYQEIEQYKVDFGMEKTKERYGKELAAFESYAALLKQKVNDNKDAFDAVADGTATKSQTERVRLLEEEQREVKLATRKNYEELLKEYQTYFQKRKMLTERFEREYKELLAKGDKEAAQARKDAFQEELNDLDEEHLKKKGIYKALFSDIADLTRKEALKIAENAKLLLNSMDPNSEAYKKLKKLLKEFEDDLSSADADRIYDLSQSIRNFADDLAYLGETTQSQALSDMAGFLSGLAEGLELLAQAMEARNTEDKMDDYIVALKGVMTLINMVASAAARRKQAEEDYYNSVLSLQLSYNLALQDQLRLEGELGDNAFVKDFEGRLIAGNAALDNAVDNYQDALDRLDEGQVKTGQRNAIDWGNVGRGAATGAAAGSFLGPVGAVAGGIIGAIAGLFGGKKKKDEWGSLLGEYPELIRDMGDGVREFNTELAQSLIDSGLLNEETQQLVQNAIDWQEAIEEARQQIREVVQELTGSFSDDLRNALVDAFRNGEDAAEAMGETVDKVLERIIQNIVFNRIFSDVFSKLEEEMAASYDVGGDRNWVDDFSRFFDQASGLTDDFNQALRDAQQQASNFGFDIFQPDQGANQEAGLQGALRREMTEETASELTGLFRGQYDITKQTYQLNERRFDLEKQQYDVSMRILAQVALISQNTGNTVIQLKYAVDELKKLNNNGASARDMGRA